MPSGGRGLGHFKDGGLNTGIKSFSNATECMGYAKKMLNYSLVTKQTGPEGLLCKSVMIVPKIDFTRSLYVAYLVDRSSSSVKYAPI